MICYRWDQRAWVQDQWECVLSHWNLISKGWVRNAPEDWKTHGKSTFITNADELPDRPLVVLAPQSGKYIQGTEPLHLFAHPRNAIYLFGHDNLNLSEEDMGCRTPDHLVYIETTDPKHYDLYAHTTANIVLYDRMIKEITYG